ncbi:MAG TPA: hypothetical protein VKX28_06040 [Xanthobacteraceae bacterium]|nr:hypothetical protein [Xanthobacteraceae bacterium]
MTEVRLIRGDAAPPRRARSDGEAPAARSPGNLNPVIRNVARASIQEIDLILLELQRIRDLVQHGGERLTRELTRYASLNQSVLATMKVIHESLKPVGSADGNARP